MVVGEHSRVIVAALELSELPVGKRDVALIWPNALLIVTRSPLLNLSERTPREEAHTYPGLRSCSKVIEVRQQLGQVVICGANVLELQGVDRQGRPHPPAGFAGRFEPGRDADAVRSLQRDKNGRGVWRCRGSCSQDRKRPLTRRHPRRLAWPRIRPLRPRQMTLPSFQPLRD